MLAIEVPDDDAGTVFAACAGRTRSAARRNALLAQRAYVEARANLYLNHAGEGSLYQLPRLAPVGIAAAELSGLYKRVLVDGGERDTYDRLRGGSRFGLCPLCAQRDVKTLDHYLSKDDFPELSVFPANLTPACFECNHAKRTYHALTAHHQLFHPYYDDWSEFRLLKADVEIKDEIEITFSIRAPDGATQEIVRRARRHFSTLGLNSLYTQNAEVELAERKLQFEKTFDSDGSVGLREELESEAESRRRFNRNSWSAALYRALARSDLFCEGGFELIDN